MDQPIFNNVVLDSLVYILQQNCNESQEVTDNVINARLKNKWPLEVLALQNPHHTYKDKVEEVYGSEKMRTYDGCTEDGEVPLATIIVFNEKWRVTIIPELSNRRCVAICLEDKDTIFFVVSMCRRPREGMKTFIEELKRIDGALVRKPTIFSLASNTKHSKWSLFGTGDARGKLLHRTIRTTRFRLTIKQLPQILDSPLDFTDLTMTSNHYRGNMHYKSVASCQMSRTHRSIYLGIAPLRKFLYGLY